MGKEREQVHAFLFDKVFTPAAGQKDVFEEISMLAQSVLDGYNVSDTTGMQNKGDWLMIGLYLCLWSNRFRKILDHGRWRCKLKVFVH